MMSRRLRRPVLLLILVAMPATALAQAEERGREEANRKPAAVVIDIHTHVWNGQDLAMAGFLNKVVMNTDEANAWRYLKRPYMVLFDLPYSHLIQPWKIPKDVMVLALKIFQVGIRALPKEAIRAITSGRWTYEKEIHCLDKLLYARSYALEHEAEMTDPVFCEGKLMRPGVPTNKLDYVTNLDVFQEAMGSAARATWFIPDRAFFKPFGLSTYYLALAANRDARWRNAQRLKNLYPKVDAYVAALVDMDHWLSDQAETTIEEQVDLLSRISILSEGTILPFVGYDPRRNIEENGRAFANVKRAILEKGFVGIKLYPPMGFRLTDNAKLDVRHFKDENEIEDVPQDKRFEYGGRLDADLEALYAWCEAHGVPIMAHGNETQGVKPDRKERAGPRYWAKVSKRHPKLRINIGHFGGSDDLIGAKSLFGWSSPRKPSDLGNWSLQIVGLIDEAGRENVYADTSMYADLLDWRVARPLGISSAERYFDVLKQNLGEDSQLPQRLMYGSDWMMLAIKQGHDRYYDTLRDAYEKVFPDFIDGYMGENAAALMGLRRGEKTRARLDAFYAAERVEPGWAEKLDAAH